MSRRIRGRSPGKTTLPDPLDVLAGRAGATAHELIRLIHQVNPSSEGLSRKQAAPRYKVKAALQSLLIRRHGDDLLVETDPTHPELIGLRLLRSGQDACHALVDELDVDARSWARRHIDEGIAMTAAPPPAEPAGQRNTSGDPHAFAEATASEPATPPELIRAGRRALDRYDYEACERYLTRAFTLSGGDATSAAALFEFHVDTAASYGKIAALEEHLSADARRDDRVRALMALAAARRGEPDAALGHLARCDSPRIPEVLFLAAEVFLKQGDEVRAEDTLCRLDRFDAPGFQADVARLRDQLAQLRAHRLAPLEREMLAAWGAGRDEDALVVAKQLRTACPGHKAALRVCRESEKNRRTRECDDNLARADAARARGDLAAEAHFLETAAALGARAGIVQDRLREILEARRQADQDAAHGNIRRAWVEGRRKEALLAWWSLPADQRTRVAPNLDARYADWLERVIAHGARAERAVEAVLALGQAVDLDAGEAPPSEVTAVLEPHLKALHAVPLAEATLRHTAERARRIATAAANEHLRQAEARLAADDVPATRALLDRIDAALLDPGSGEVLADVTARCGAREQYHRLVATHEAAARGHDYFRAREAAARLAQSTTADEADAWLRTAEDHGARIRALWSMRVFDTGPLPFFYLTEGLPLAQDEAWGGLATDSRSLVFATMLGGHLLVTVFDIETQRARRTIVLCPPRPLSFADCKTFGDELWLESAGGRIVVLTLAPPDIVGWFDLSDLSDPANGRVLEHTWVSPGKRFAWLDSSNSRAWNREGLEIVDLDTRRVLRRHAISGIPYTIKTRDGFLVAVDAFETERLQLFDGHGRSREELTFPTPGIKDCAAVHPNGRDLIFLTAIRPIDAAPADAEAGVADYRLALEVRPDRDHAFVPLYLDGSNGEMAHSIATALADSLVAVLWRAEANHVATLMLTTFRPTDSGFEQLYQLPTESGAVLATDEHCQRVAVCNLTADPPQVTVLTPRRPSIPPPLPNAPPIALPGTGLSRFGSCDRFLAEALAGSPELSRLLLDVPEETVRERVLEFRAVAADDPLRSAALALTLESLRHHSLAQEEWDRIGRVFATNNRVRIALATRAARRGDWGRVAAWLGEVPRELLDRNDRAHCHHLEGLSLFCSGDLGEARRLWREAAAGGGDPCCERELVDYADLLLSSDLPAACLGRPDSPAAGALAFLLAIERHIAARDWVAARAEIDRLPALPRRDIQLMARCAETCLNVDISPADPAWICKMVVLETFLMKPLVEIDPPLMPPQVAAWPPERLDGIALECRRWLGVPVDEPRD